MYKIVLLILLGISLCQFSAGTYPSSNIDNFVYNVPKNMPYDIKRGLSSNSDPEIAKFGSTIDKHLIEKFLNFFRRYDGTQVDNKTWQLHLNLFLDDYFSGLPPMIKTIIYMANTRNTIDKSLRFIVSHTKELSG